MIDVPYSEFAEAMLRLRHSPMLTQQAIAWRWILFDQDLNSGTKVGCRSTGPTVSLGLPWLSPECSLRWIGPRVFFWPQGIPQRRRVSIVSSRLKKRLDQESWWFNLLRTAILRSDPTTDLLIAVAGTAPYRYVCRAAALFGRSMIEFHVDSNERQADHDAIAAWMTKISDSLLLETAPASHDSETVAEPKIVEGYDSGTHWPVFVSPPLSASDHADSEITTTMPNTLSGQSIADRILFAVGDCLQVIQIRTSGTIQTLLTQHIVDIERNQSIVMLASNAAGQISAIGHNSSGCVIPWLLQSNESVSQTNERVSQTAHVDRQGQLAASDPLSHPGDWLLHWTRSTVGPWPDQDEQQFNDELILGCRSADRSAFATLLRIVTEGCLWASSETIRGRFQVVSFTEVPLREFRDRRAYRRHRRRYDFEPWGIAVRRDVLESAGARPVEYGDDETWHQTSETDKAFFQNAGAEDGWIRDEREWRILNNLKLNDLPVSAVVVFVDTEAAREITQNQTGWRVIVVPK